MQVIVLSLLPFTRVEGSLPIITQIMTDTIRPTAGEVTTTEIPGAKQSEKLAIPAVPRPGLLIGEPTPDQLAAEEELMREDLAAFEHEVLSVVSAENTNRTPTGGRELDSIWGSTWRGPGMTAAARSRSTRTTSNAPRSSIRISSA